jgi:hypothetical protein
MNENDPRNAHGARTLPPAPASRKNSRKLHLFSELLRAQDHRIQLPDDTGANRPRTARVQEAANPCPTIRANPRPNRHPTPGQLTPT